MEASATRPSRNNVLVDYKKLDTCSADMYEPLVKRRNKASRSGLYVVEPVISKRQNKQVCDDMQYFNNRLIQ